jgi:transcriptional regulator with XRE-family HTH domain
MDQPKPMRELTRIREERGLSQQRLADASGVNKATINQIERGRRSPNLETLEKLAGALGVELSDFFPKDQPPLPLNEVTGAARFLTLDADLLRTICESMAGHYEELADRDVPPSRALGWWDVAPYDAGFVLAMVDVLLEGVQDGSIADDEDEIIPLLRAAYRLAHFADALWGKSVEALAEEIERASVEMRFWQATERIELTEDQKEAIVS